MQRSETFITYYNRKNMSRKIWYMPIFWKSMLLQGFYSQDTQEGWEYGINTVYYKNITKLIEKGLPLTNPCVILILPCYAWNKIQNKPYDVS